MKDANDGNSREITKKKSQKSKKKNKQTKNNKQAIVLLAYDNVILLLDMSLQNVI